jgi:hypothetical protein
LSIIIDIGIIMMMNRKNLPGVANPLRRPLPVVLDPVGRAVLAMPNKNMVRPIVRFGNKKMKIGFA